MRIVLGIIVLSCFGVMIAYIIKNMIEEIRRVREQDKQYRMALSFIKGHHKHCGEIPSPAYVWTHSPQWVKKEIAIKAYEDYLRGENL